MTRTNITQLMTTECINANIEIYSNRLKGTHAEEYFYNQISTDYIRSYRNEHNKFETAEEKEVIEKLIVYFQEKQDFRRCAQLQRILNGEELSTKYMF